jgi:hypothetical protein
MLGGKLGICLEAEQMMIKDAEQAKAQGMQHVIYQDHEDI